MHSVGTAPVVPGGPSMSVQGQFQVPGSLPRMEDQELEVEKEGEEGLLFIMERGPGSADLRRRQPRQGVPERRMGRFSI